MSISSICTNSFLYQDNPLIKGFSLSNSTDQYSVCVIDKSICIETPSWISTEKTGKIIGNILVVFSLFASNPLFSLFDKHSKISKILPSGLIFSVFISGVNLLNKDYFKDPIYIDRLRNKEG